jgi:hypothetical protein
MSRHLNNVSLFLVSSTHSINLGCTIWKIYLPIQQTLFPYLWRCPGLISRPLLLDRGPEDYSSLCMPGPQNKQSAPPNSVTLHLCRLVGIINDRLHASAKLVVVTKRRNHLKCHHQRFRQKIVYFSLRPLGNSAFCDLYQNCAHTLFDWASGPSISCKFGNSTCGHQVSSHSHVVASRQIHTIS